jgi:hypothetical protein
MYKGFDVGDAEDLDPNLWARTERKIVYGLSHQYVVSACVCSMGVGVDRAGYVPESENM